MPTEFETKRDKFQFKRSGIQLENDQTFSQGIEPSFQSWQ